ncbi:hypothetical protein FHX37_0495 [Haloactinospora alba]|uniref:Uncharacterized protein n=1 Tax=Haloactinospora alba TaxID=405555 RepID=A0A543NFJ7_9ACTN|nr:hypothetical protein [Haloactinospora alba]TQN30613.1 hypothetical protein FHX37_0495 [Haloactinospora alba]
MALITTHTISTDGGAPTFGAADNADTAETGSTNVLVVKNASASSVDVTIAGQGTLASGADYPDRVYTVAASEEAWIPLLSVYRNVDGEAELSYEATADVTRAVVRL